MRFFLLFPSERLRFSVSSDYLRIFVFSVCFVLDFFYAVHNG